MPLDPGSIIALVLVAYKGTSTAWDTFRDTLHFPADSEDLVLRLELERFRFQTWAANAGLTEGTFAAGLVPIHETVERQLRLIGGLVSDLDQLRSRYGLSAPQSEDIPVERVTKFIAKMKNSLRASGIKVDAPDADEIQASDEPRTDRALPSRLRRIRWGLRDRKRFEDLLSTLEAHVEKLNQLLTETQQWTARKDNERINILVVGNIEDDKSLQLIREAVQQKPETSAVRTLIERKAIAEDTPWSSRAGLLALSPLRLKDFILPSGYQSQNRFLATTFTDPEKHVLFEKKSFDVDLSEHEKYTLRARIQRLVLLLSGPRTGSFRTPHALAFIHDPDNFCWWLVFHWTPSNPSEVEFRSVATQPISLQALLHSKFKPPLEQRLRLASDLACTLSELYSSGWLHKGIRSDNIVFPQLYSKENKISLNSFRDISSPLLIGFNYSRQESEERTIDKSKIINDSKTSIYRHPAYQGEAAQGYKIHYDIYSFGLVLVEIALWVSLITFLDAIESKSSKSEFSVLLSSKMTQFHRTEALELQRRVQSRADRELAFRVGAKYHGAVKWCLNFADRSTDGPQEEEWHPALEFYNEVVIPLADFAKFGG
jgi:hypothetical protein